MTKWISVMTKRFPDSLYETRKLDHGQMIHWLTESEKTESWPWQDGSLTQTLIYWMTERFLVMTKSFADLNSHTLNMRENHIHKSMIHWSETSQSWPNNLLIKILICKHESWQGPNDSLKYKFISLITKITQKCITI